MSRFAALCAKEVYQRCCPSSEGLQSIKDIEILRARWADRPTLCTTCRSITLSIPPARTLDLIFIAVGRILEVMKHDEKHRSSCWIGAMMLFVIDLA